MKDRETSFFSGRNFAFGVVTGAIAVAGLLSFISRPGQLGQQGASSPSVAANAGSSTARSANSLEPASRAADIFPSFDVVRISRGGTGVIAGRAAPGSMIDVLSDEKVVGTARTEGNGAWVMIIDRPLPSGPAELSLLARLNDGRTLESEDIVVVAVPEAPDTEHFAEVMQDGVVAVLTPKDGSGPSRVLQKPGSSAVGEIADQLTLDTIDYDEQGTTMIAGRAAPRAEVAIYVDNTYAGRTKADDDGRWTLSPEARLSIGAHVLRMDQLIDDGAVELRIEQPFEAGLPVDSEQASEKIYVRPGNSLWHIARLIYGSGYRYTLIFQENVEQIRDPDLIYPGQEFKLPRRTGQAIQPG